MDTEEFDFKVIGTTKELFEAWSDAKVKLGSHVFPEGRNPHFGNDYITLHSLIKKIDSVTKSVGLGIIQFPTGSGLITILFHKKTGNYIQSYYKLILDKQTPQGVGSALTYAKRQILQAMFGLSAGEEEDDDAEASINYEDDDNKYAEDPPVTNANAYKIAKAAIKDINSLDELAEWWSDLGPTIQRNKKVRDLKDSRKAELNVKA